ncbi:MAG: hypothetical protein RL173_3749 [Fibrobacterota bacterium]
MRIVSTVLIGLAMATTSAFAVTGTIKDENGAAIPSVQVGLVSNPSKTVLTDSKGEFLLDSPSGVAPKGSARFSNAQIRGLSIEGNRILLSLASSSLPEFVTMVSVDGKLTKLPSLGRMESGELAFSLPKSTPGLYVLQIEIDGSTATANLVQTGHDLFIQGNLSIPVSGAALARSQAGGAIDTVVATKTGFATTKTAITSYDQTGLAIVMKTLAARSTGCDKTRTLANGTLSLQSGGKTRKYILNVPASYDKTQAYRLVFAFAESGSSAQSVATRNYFRMATYDSKNTIFVAPEAENGAGSWSKTDVNFTDDILAQVQGDLCIDKSRIFATGFSFGGAMSIAIACTRADVFRGVAFFSGADLTGSCPTTLTKPIAYYASQASGDASGTPIPTSGRIKQAQFAAINGCTAEANSTTFPAAGKAHTCTVYKNCKAGYPTVYCVFDGPHGWEPTDPGQSTSWNPPEAWKFIAQF